VPQEVMAVVVAARADCEAVTTLGTGRILQAMCPTQDSEHSRTHVHLQVDERRSEKVGLARRLLDNRTANIG
jgi:hypothetical protein